MGVQKPLSPNAQAEKWFINFSRCGEAKTLEFDLEQVAFETFCSGGKGGQNVNKVETSVRAIYLPTGEAVVCTEERSQYANKQKAIARLRELAKAEDRAREAEAKNGNWQAHNRLERGNAGMRLEGEGFDKR